MAKLKNLIGQKFGRLLVVGRAENDKYGRAKWTCKCDCGNPELVVVRSQHLIRGSVMSCGCLQREREDLTGQRFNKLVVLSSAPDHVKPNGDCVARWNCECDCGNFTVVDGASLKNGHTKSCGCLQGEHHMDSCHNVGRTRLYRIWQDMRQRCSNPNNNGFQDYGGRGITVCDEWNNSYIAFKEWATSNGYADDLSIDRIDVNGAYEPSNCRWSTFVEQANNTRTNRSVTYNNETLTLAQWRKRLGFKRGVLEYRLNSGWSEEKAFTTPVKARNSTKLIIE